jgi:hypothetical protein
VSARSVALLRGLLALALLLGLGRASIAGDAVGIRASEHPDYARFVFDWPEPVAFTVATRGRNLWVRFDHALSADPKDLVRPLRRYIAGARLSDDRKGLDIVLTGPYRLESFALGKSVVFDLRPIDGSAEAGGSIRDAGYTDIARSADTAAPLLPVRVGNHEKYLRLVFDWRKPVDYTIDEAGDLVHLRFGGAARIDLAALRKQLPADFSRTSAKSESGALTLTFPRRPGWQIRHFKAGSKVVVDFLRGADSAARGSGAAAKAEKATKQAEAKQPEKSAKKEPEEPPPVAAPVPKVQEDTLSKAPAAGEKPAEGQAAAGDGGQAQETPAADAKNGGEDAAGAGTEAKPSPGANKAVSLVFEWPEPVGAAVFRREPYVWVVFDKRAELNLAALRTAGADVITMIEQLPVGTGTVLRLIPKEGLSPQVDREGSNWVIRFRRGPISPQVPIALRVRPEADEGTQLELPVSEFGQIIHIPDPDVGDMIIAATVRAVGHGIAGIRRYPEFELLPSAQGVGLEPLSDDVEIRNAGDRGLVVSAPGGLQISAVSQGSAKTGSYLGPSVFNLTNWQRGKDEPFITARQTVFEAVVEAPPERRDDARLDIARFYFARGFGTEALGVLRTIEFANQDMASQPEVRALKGAVQVLMRRPYEARKDLLDPGLDQYQEIELWRGSMFLQSGEAKKAAAHFRAGEPALQGYPEPIKSRLAVQLVEASLADLDVELAARWLDQLSSIRDTLPRDLAARVLYDQGLLARDSRKLDDAVAIWTKAKEGDNPWAAAHAEYALIELGLQQETITPDEAIERLDHLRFQWRGDDLELDVLERLGKLYLAKDEYRKGLTTLRTAVTYFPEQERVKSIAKTMTDAFRNLHLAGEADRLPPLKALALYDDFRELTPAGPEGDLMIQRLADRLVAVDLLDRAASLLAHQVRYRLKGEERARVGEKLALILLLDRNPKGALAALRNSFQPNLPYDVEDDRRRIRAKATMELGHNEEAIALLAGDVSREADLLRASIYWSMQDYAEAAKVLQRLAGDPLEEGAYPEDQARYILNWAVALRLKRDEAGIKMLRDLYGPGMAKSKLADAFAYISSNEPDNVKNIEAMSKRIAETDKFDGFLKNYRERLIAPVAEAPKAGKDQAPADAMQQTPAAASTPAAPPQAAPAAIPPPPPPPRG